MILCNLLSLWFTILQQSQVLNESAILQEYLRNVPEIVDVYSNNIFVKERYTQKTDGLQLIGRDNVHSMYFCDKYVFTHSSSSDREEVNYASNKAYFKILRVNNSVPWLLAYNITPNSNSKIELLKKSNGHNCLDLPYKSWSSRIDVRDLIGVKKETPPVRDKPKYDQPEWKLVTIRKVPVDQHTRYRFYYRSGEGIPNEKLDDIPCHGSFDVAPHLHWVIVGEKYFRSQTEITYEGEIAGIPAIKKAVASTTGDPEPYMTYEILEISDHDQTNPAEHTLEFYGHGSLLHGLTGPWHLLFFGASGVFIIVAVFLQRKPSAIAKKPTTSRDAQ
jgi:hypothetical protein